MLLQENFIDYENSRLHYAKAGSGAIPLLVFHGFGQNHKVFEQGVQALGNEYSLFAFDLYFHGQSTWPDRRALGKREWKEIINSFLRKENIDRFSVLGFSLGGKFALGTLEAFPEKIKSLFLLAPDGIKTSLWYNLATYPLAGRHLFKSMILKPGRLFGIVKMLRALNLVDKGVLRFAESQMNTEEKRRRVYYSWVCFRHLKFNLANIAHLLNSHQVPVIIFVGKYDKIIEAKNMNCLLRRVANHRFEIVEAGHNDLLEKVLPFGLIKTKAVPNLNGMARDPFTNNHANFNISC